MKRQSLHVKDDAIYDQFTKQQVIWTHGYGATDGYVTRNEWGALLLQWPVPVALLPPESRADFHMNQSWVFILQTF